MQGSHAAGTWEQLLEILLSINKEIKISSIADIACGLSPIEFHKISSLEHIDEIYRLDGNKDFDCKLTVSI